MSWPVSLVLPKSVKFWSLCLRSSFSKSHTKPMYPKSFFKKFVSMSHSTWVNSKWGYEKTISSNQRKGYFNSNTEDVLLVFSVTPFKIDQNKNQNRSIDKVQNLGNERRYIYKDPRQDSGQRNISYTRYPKKCFTQIYRDLYGDAMLVSTWMGTNMADGNQQKHLLRSFSKKREFIPRGTHKH